MKIEGVVAPHGGGAGSRDGGRTWSITFTLDPWREAGGDWRRRDPLYVTVPARSKAVASRQGVALRGGMILSLAVGRIAPPTRYALQSTEGRPPVRRRIDGRPCELLLELRDADDPASMTADVAKASPLLRRTERQLPAVRRAIARALLPTDNDRWREDRPRLSASAFLKRIAPTSVTLAPTRVTILFRAGHLFTDHAIEVRVGARGAISEILLAG